jgi:hypothetical protein
MAETLRNAGMASTDASALADPSATFEKLQELLKAKDDTSRFVGLALLKSVLDNGQLVQDLTRMLVLWEALSPKFLDRLLRAQQNEKLSKTEARDMVDLAVAVLHTFTILLPETSLKEKRVVGRIIPLVKALVHRSASPMPSRHPGLTYFQPSRNYEIDPADHFDNGQPAGGSIRSAIP